jgi:hypothetical protein
VSSDLIFAAIERHKTLYAALCRVLTSMGECEKGYRGKGYRGLPISPELAE